MLQYYLILKMLKFKHVYLKLCHTKFLQWKNIINKIDPDFIMIYNIFGFDFKYISNNLMYYLIIIIIVING